MEWDRRKAEKTNLHAGGRRRRWAVDALIIVTGIVAGSLVLLWPVFNSKNWGKPLGRAVPLEPPDEANRVGHPQGFSIIYPPNWEVRVQDAPPKPSLNGSPRSLIPSRNHAMLLVVKHGRDVPFDLSGFHPVEFQGEPAHEEEAVRQVQYEKPPAFVYGLIFQRGGCWYEVRYYNPDQLPSLPEIIRQYLSTFRTDISTHGAKPMICAKYHLTIRRPGHSP